MVDLVRSTLLLDDLLSDAGSLGPDALLDLLAGFFGDDIFHEGGLVVQRTARDPHAQFRLARASIYDFAQTAADCLD